MKFTQDDIRRIKDAAAGKLTDIIGDFRELRRSGKDYVCDCPRCGGKDKFSVSPAKGIFKCWSCPDTKGADAVSYLMKVEGMARQGQSSRQAEGEKPCRQRAGHRHLLRPDAGRKRACLRGRDRQGVQDR